MIAWFGNTDWGLGLPFPALMAWLAVSTEILGAVALLLGLATRWFCIPLMIQMIVAATSVHWHNGWQAVADPMSPFAGANIDGAVERLAMAKDLRIFLSKLGDPSTSNTYSAPMWLGMSKIELDWTLLSHVCDNIGGMWD